MIGIYIHITESQREAEPPLYNQFPPILRGETNGASKRGTSPSFFTSPSPYQGEGDKGDRVNKNLKGVRLITISSGFYWTYNQKRSKIKQNEGLREVENMCLAVTVILWATKEALSLTEPVLLNY